AAHVDERELFLERRHQVIGRLAVVLVATPATGHGDHQVLIEALTQTIGAGGDALRSPFGACICDDIRVTLTLIGLTVRQKDDALEANRLRTSAQSLGPLEPACMQGR